MEKHIIFLVHGMGDTLPGWSNPIQALIRQKYGLYRVAGRQGFDASFSFTEINYNQLFESHLDKWRDNGAAVTRLLEASGIDSKLLGTLSGFNKSERKDFASSQVLDVILYRFMKGIKAQIIAHISEQLVGKLNQSARPAPYSIIAHSLGTAVMHDVMQANLTTDHFPLSTAHGLPRLYMTLANVSRVLQDADTNVYSSAMRPQLADQNRPYGCSQFVNVAHRLDPFTRVRSFKPGWKKGAASALNNLRYEAYQSVSISGLSGLNPHDFEHYLQSPETQVALFRGLLSKRSISDAELATQLEQHRQLTLAGQFDATKSAIRQIPLEEALGLNETVQAWYRYQKEMDRLTTNPGGV